jgi:hypothetical protein
MALMMLNADEAARLPEQKKKAYIDRFKTWADANNVKIGSPYFNKHYLLPHL